MSKEKRLHWINLACFVIVPKACSEYNTIRSITEWNNLLRDIESRLQRRKKHVKGTSQYCIREEEAFLEHNMLSAACVSLGKMTFNPVNQTQSSHSSVYVEVFVTFRHAFPSAGSQAQPQFTALHHLLGTRPGGEGTAGKGWLKKAPRILQKVQKSPLLSKLKEPEGTFTKHKGSVRREKQNTSEWHDHTARKKTFEAKSFVYFLAFGNMMTDMFTKA